MTKPYERLPRESDPAWKAFVLFRDSDPRTTGLVARTVGKSTTVIQRWSAANAWMKRARAWDMEKDRRKREVELNAIEKMRARHIEIGLSMQGVGAAQLKKLHEMAEKAPGQTLKSHEIVELLEEGTKLERLSRGEPGEIVQHGAAKTDLSLLSNDELRQLKAMRAKVRATSENEEEGNA